MRLACLAVVAVACTATDEVNYSLRAPDELEPHLVALRGWATIGIVRDDLTPDPIYLERVPDDAIPADGVAYRADRVIRVRQSLAGIRLLVILAHEVGHVVLDTPQHTTCGIMSASDTFPCDQDIALACESFPQLGVCK